MAAVNRYRVVAAATVATPRIVRTSKSAKKDPIGYLKNDVLPWIDRSKLGRYVHLRKADFNIRLAWMPKDELMKNKVAGEKRAMDWVFEAKALKRKQKWCRSRNKLMDCDLYHHIRQNLNPEKYDLLVAYDRTGSGRLSKDGRVDIVTKAKIGARGVKHVFLSKELRWIPCTHRTIKIIRLQAEKTSPFRRRI